MWIYKLERKIPWFKIPNLTLWIAIISGLVYFFDLVSMAQSNNFNLSSLIYFNRDLIFGGQVWRLVTFIFVPPSSVFSPLGSNIIFILLSLYFLYFIGTGLESVWGEFKLTVYYTTGLIFAILGGLLVGQSNPTFLNLSLFLAFAALYPDLSVMIFFIIPVKVKWLGYFSSLVLLFSIISSLFALRWSNAVAATMAVANFLLFFGPRFFSDMINKLKYLKSRQDFINKTKNSWQN